MSDGTAVAGPCEPKNLWILDAAVLQHRLADPRGESSSREVRGTEPRIACAVVLDAASRTVIAAVYVPSTQPIPWESLLRRAIVLKRGVEAWPMFRLPEVVRFDRGVPYAARTLVEHLSALGVRIEHTPAGVLAPRGAVERWFAALQRTVLHTLPPFQR